MSKSGGRGSFNRSSFFGLQGGPPLRGLEAKFLRLLQGFAQKRPGTLQEHLPESLQTAVFWSCFGAAPGMKRSSFRVHAVSTLACATVCPPLTKFRRTSAVHPQRVASPTLFPSASAACGKALGKTVNVAMVKWSRM